MNGAQSIWKLWHRYFGITVGVYLALMGATGSMVLFRDEIEAVRYRVSAPPDAVPLGADELLVAVRHRYPNQPAKTLSRMDIPADPHVCRRFVFGGFDDLSRTRFVYVHPYNASIVSDRNVLRDPFGLVWATHLFLLGGTRGTTWHGYLGMAASVLLLTGFAAWLPSAARQMRARLAATSKTPIARLFYDTHTIGGGVVVPLLLLLAVTGTAFAWEDALHKALHLPEPPKYRVMPRTIAPLSADALLRVAENRLPTYRVRRLTLPAKPGEPARVQLTARRPMLLPRATVTLEPYTGAVLAVQKDDEMRGAARLLAALPALHFGAWGGTASKILYATVALTAPGLFASGVYLYLRRRRKPAPPRRTIVAP